MNCDLGNTSACVRFAICAAQLDFNAVTSILGLLPSCKADFEQYSCWMYDICDSDCWDIDPLLARLVETFQPCHAGLLEIAKRFQAELHIDILIEYGSHTMNFTIDRAINDFIHEINATVAIETTLKNSLG